MTMRFQTRTFLLCFVPFVLLLGTSFWMMQRLVQSTVRSSLRTSLRDSQTAISRIQSRSDLQNSRFLRVAGENAALKAGMQLLLAEPASDSARRTVEDQLRELGEHMDLDFLLVSTPDGRPLVAVASNAAPNTTGSRAELVPLNETPLTAPQTGLALINGQALEIGSVPLDASDENLASLWVGKRFNLADLATPAVLLHNGSVIQSTVPNVTPSQLHSALQACNPTAECDVRLAADDWISLPVSSTADGLSLRSLSNVDAAAGSVQQRLRVIFLSVALGAMLIVFLASAAASRSIVQPIDAIVANLRRAAATGELPQFAQAQSPISEVRELTASYNRAAVAVHKARTHLEQAYVDFISALAHALDARDPYTAGHSRRVSDVATALATAMQLPPETVETIRIGALLHDIGKIGIADSILQKSGALTDADWEILETHTLIGRSILEPVHGFAPYLPAVELHHENWDGSGYPRRLSGQSTPVEARIIHIADAYDAMTTDRSYRRGMDHAQAIQVITEYAGTQFDPHVVRVLVTLSRSTLLAAAPVGPAPAAIKVP